MKIQYYLLLLITISACSNPNNESNMNVRVDSSKNSTKIYPQLKNPLISKIIGDTTGLIRGYDFGDPIEDIIATEKNEKFEESKNHIGYTFDTSNLETVDILYYMDKEKSLNAIQLDIYMNSDSSNDTLFVNFSEYFNAKYGPQIPKLKIPIWKIDENQEVYIKKVKSRLDRGLEIKFYTKN